MLEYRGKQKVESAMENEKERRGEERGQHPPRKSCTETQCCNGTQGGGSIHSVFFFFSYKLDGRKSKTKTQTFARLYNSNPALLSSLPLSPYRPVACAQAVNSGTLVW